jgi:putative ABC transport system permease protein
MEFRPILSTLRRHRTAAALMVLEIAVTCAIICNAVFLIADRIDRLHYPSGIAESELVRINIRSIAKPADEKARTQHDLAVLRQLPGVRAATLVNQVPFGDSSWATGVSVRPDQVRETLNAALYAASEDFMKTTGVRLVAGRDFTPEEINDYVDVFESGTAPALPVVIVTQRAARKFFPGQDALGQMIYVFGDSPSRIVGIVEELARPNNLLREPHALIVPIRVNGGQYLLRTDPSQRHAVAKAAADALLAVDRQRVVVKQESLEDVRRAYFRTDRAMAWLLAAVCIALLVVTALGIVGLASFWVQQRTRMIGIRRAVGATERQILRYFQAENWLLTSAGIALGMIGAYAINRLLMAHYELPALPLVYLPVGALVLWSLGQLAVLGPALRAAALPPVAVMRLR